MEGVVGTMVWRDEAEADTLMKLQKDRKNKVAVVKTKLASDRGKGAAAEPQPATSAILDLTKHHNTSLQRRTIYHEITLC